MQARELLFSFLDTVFLIFLVLFFIFFIFIGGHLDLAEKIIKITMICSIFVVVAIIKAKEIRSSGALSEREGIPEEIRNYIDVKDLVYDQIIICSASLAVPVLSWLFGRISPIDTVQSIFVFVLINFWHLYLFRIKDIASRLRFLTARDELADRIVIFALSVFLLFLALFAQDVGFLDLAKVVLVFFILFLWHRYLFYPIKGRSE